MEVVSSRKANVLAVPYPAQGHVKPLLQLCRQIAKHGIKVTFVNTQSIHDKMFASSTMSGETGEDNVVLATIPDVLDDDPNRSLRKLTSLRNTVPQLLEDLIERINGSNPDEKISCVIADPVLIGSVLETARKMGAEPLLFSPSSAAFCALVFHIPKLLEDGILDANGSVKKGEQILLSDDLSGWGEGELAWNIPGEPEKEKGIFEYMKQTKEEISQVKMVLTNTCYELESSACDLTQNLLPIGPLVQTSINKSSSDSCSFYPEDESCLSWLDTKPPGSVIYVSFGSIAVFSQQQLDELALGLELSGRPFLWVVRSDITNGSWAEYPDGFLDRVMDHGMIVTWVPQQKVLSNPSIACFLSHCGWNSTLEGLSNGVPFLCWPCFCDQFHNQSYICDKWETGLRISPDESGIRSRYEIKKKVDMLFFNGKLKANALSMKELSAKAVHEGGSSFKNFERFIDHLRMPGFLE